MRVFAELPWALDAREWGERHAAGLVPDASPYGLHRVALTGDDRVDFRPPLGPGPVSWCARRLQGRMQGYEFVPAAASRLRWPPAHGYDVILSMDERTGIPAALMPGGPPVVSGVAWLERRSDVPRWLRPTVDHGLAAAAELFVECRAMEEPLTSQFGVDPDRLHFVRLGIDAEHFRPEPFPAGPEPMVFSVGDDRMRDHVTLIAAIRTLRESGCRLRFELATTLPVDVPPALGIVHARRMDDAVRGCYARSTVVAVALHPTRQGSGLTVILEAMASGRPVVVTDNPGLSDYVVHGTTGFLVPPGDPQSMAAAVARLVHDPALAAAMGAAGRATVHQKFTSAHMAADLRTVLESAVRRAQLR